MQWKKISMAAAAGALLLMSGCDAGVSEASVSPAAAVSGEAAAASEIVSTESAAAATPDEAAALATPAADDMMVPVVGQITELDPDEHMVTISPGGEETTDPSLMTTAVITDDTLLVDAETVRTISEADLTAGQTVSAALSPMMTRSIPPQAQAYALIANLPESGVASYVRALDVMSSENGDTIILNQNADLYITVPADMKIEILDSTEEAAPSDIKTGSSLIVWYETVAESYPGQTTATRVALAG